MKLTAEEMRRNAVIYARVSSEDQAKNYSLTGQKEACEEYAKRNNLTIRKTWSGPESAWGKEERANFNEMLTFVKKDNSIKHIIFYVEDRMTRNYRDKIKIEELILNHGVYVHFALSKSIYGQDAAANDKFMMNISVAVSSKISDDISDKTKMGMETKAKAGIHPGAASIGYLNIVEGTQRKIKIDHIKAPLIKELFSLVASGSYSLNMLVPIMYEKGLRTKRGIKASSATLHYIIKNKIYYGQIVWNGKIYTGSHEPIISEDLYNRANQALAAAWRPHLTKQNHPFSNLMICKHCGCSIVADRAKKKYTYYRCSASKEKHGNNHYFREKELDSIFQGVVDKLIIPKDVAKWIQKAVDRKIEKVNEQKKQDITKIRQKLGLVKANLDNLYTNGLDKGYTPEFIRHNEERYKNQILEYETLINTSSVNTNEIYNKSIDILELVSSRGYNYKTFDLHKKAEFMRKIASRYEVFGTQITPIYREPFNIFADERGDKKECLEPIGIIPKSSKHLEWLPGLGSNQQP